MSNWPKILGNMSIWPQDLFSEALQPWRNLVLLFVCLHSESRNTSICIVVQVTVYGCDTCQTLSINTTYYQPDILSMWHIINATYQCNILITRHIVIVTYYQRDILSMQHIINVTHYQRDRKEVYHMWQVKSPRTKHGEMIIRPHLT
jgi:hypothetical protein